MPAGQGPRRGGEARRAAWRGPGVGGRGAWARSPARGRGSGGDGLAGPAAREGPGRGGECGGDGRSEARGLARDGGPGPWGHGRPGAGQTGEDKGERAAAGRGSAVPERGARLAAAQFLGFGTGTGALRGRSALGVPGQHSPPRGARGRVAAPGPVPRGPGRAAGRSGPTGTGPAAGGSRLSAGRAAGEAGGLSGTRRRRLPLARCCTRKCEGVGRRDLTQVPAGPAPRGPAPLAQRGPPARPEGGRQRVRAFGSRTTPGPPESAHRRSKGVRSAEEGAEARGAPSPP